MSERGSAHPFWRGVARGIVLAWLVSGVPGAAVLVAGGHFGAASLMAVGFVLAVHAVELLA